VKNGGSIFTGRAGANDDAEGGEQKAQPF